ncbi:MAG: prolyl oligopeptidase family serine peptidase [Flavisolibacter sp.]|nr:prolyl oligopeptidase family serine peptidase [Flavisolibacter sp.]MBD0368390.1 prolyl oligopeptidase family serine peptidase [Flavisolibacter sp.]
MKLILLIALFIAPCVASTQTKGVTQLNQYPSTEKVASDFRALLQRPAVDFRPSFQSFITDSVLIEKGFIYTEETEKVPILIYKPATHGATSFPVVICLHGTGGSKDDESIKNLLYQFSKIGIMGVAIDARYHGERIQGGADKSEQYVEAITRAWKNSDSNQQQHPFYYDTVYDLWKLTDYLITRPDVQPNRIGMMGISMGGIETWMAASVDKRIKVAVPVIAAQSFKWSLDNNSWQGRARTIWNVHEQAATDLGDSIVTKENVKLVWEKLIPGITDEFDCPSMIRLFAPRPLLLLNNEKDQNCPLQGAQLAFEAATNAYKTMNALNKLKIHITPNEPHRFLPEHAEMTIAWFKKWL